MSTNEIHRENDEDVIVVNPEEGAGYGQPARAPKDSLWAKQEGIDFFLPPALSLEALDYLSFNGEGPEQALRARFGLPTDQKDAA